MSAVVYRGRPIALFDLDYDIFFGYCSKEPVVDLESSRIEDTGVTPVLDLVFNLNPDLSLLAATYIDGDLALFEPCELSLLVVIQADATVLSCSPNGRTLATGSSDGTIELYEFETLRLLYRIQADDYAIRAIAFSCDSLRFVDVRGPQSSIWEPSVLVRSEGAETESVSDTTLPVPKTVEVGELDSIVQITTLLCHENGKDIFCGKDDGTISVYEATTGRQNQSLYQHIGGIAILSMAWGRKRQILATVDASSSIVIRKLTKTAGVWQVEESLLNTRIENSVCQLVLDSENTYLLASTVDSDTIWNLESGTSKTRIFGGRHAWRWVDHPVQTYLLLLVDSRTVTIFNWDQFEQMSGSARTEIKSAIPTEGSPSSVHICVGGRFVAINFNYQSRDQSSNELLLIDPLEVRSESEVIAPLADFIEFSGNVKYFLGILGSKLLFLDHQLWVCSLNLIEQKGKLSRHFFLPDEWVTTNRNLICQVTSQGSLVFARHDSLAIVHRGLKLEEVISGPTAQRPRSTLTLLHKAQSAPG